MRLHRHDRRPVIVILTLLLMLGVAGRSDASPADARVVTPADRTPSVTPEPQPADASWQFRVGTGFSAGGDLFQVKSDATETWTAPVAATDFSARRFTATLDESVLISAGLARRLTSRGWLQLDFTWTEMNVTALALSGQVVDLVPYDVLTFTRLGLAWEQRLLDTPLAPYVRGGVTWLDLSAKSDALTQSGLAPTVGVGAVWRMQGAWAVRAELTDTITQLESDGVTAVDWPEAATYTERGPQHLIGIDVGLVVSF